MNTLAICGELSWYCRYTVEGHVLVVLHHLLLGLLSAAFAGASPELWVLVLLVTAVTSLIKSPGILPAKKVEGALLLKLSETWLLPFDMYEEFAGVDICSVQNSIENGCLPDIY